MQSRTTTTQPAVQIQTATILYEPLYGDFKQEKELKKFIDLYKNRLVNAWVDYFVYHKRIRFTKITKKL